MKLIYVSSVAKFLKLNVFVQALKKWKCFLNGSQMGRYQLLKSFIGAINSVSLNISTRQSFLVCCNQCHSSKFRRFTSKTITPGYSEVKRSAIDPVENLDLSDYGSVLPPSFNFAAYADKSPMLQQLIKLGVNFFEIEKEPNVDYILTLQWENIKKYLSFLTDNGVPSEKLGEFITKNPFIFKEDLEDLHVRITYLESKKFSKDMISNILVRNPKWLSIPVKVIDERLGYLQQSFGFHGDQVREIISRCPSLGTINKKKLMLNIFTIKEDLYLDSFSARKLVLSEPKLLRRGECPLLLEVLTKKLSRLMKEFVPEPYELVSTFDYLTKTMNVALDLVLKQAKVLTTRKFLLMERHLFLQSLGRAQYNHLLPGYVSLEDLTLTTDEEFCEKVARTSLDCYEKFLKTL